MCLVQVDVGSVLLLDGDDFRQWNDGALHRVDAFHHDENLLVLKSKLIRRFKINCSIIPVKIAKIELLNSSKSRNFDLIV